MLLPDFCDVRTVFMVVLLIEVLALVLTMVIPAATDDFWNYLAFISMFMQWIGLINTALLCRGKNWLNRLELKFALVYSYVMMMLVSFGVSVGLLILKDTLALDDITAPLVDHFLLRVMLISAVIYALLLRYFYIQYEWHRNVSSQARAELQALQARIRPHFLFNSMNTIASLISFKPESAEKAVEDLSDLFRASLKEQTFHTLSEEIELARSYLDIEILRLGDRLRIEWQIEDSLKEKEIPSLSLQPLVENAIYHGIEPLVTGGTINITAIRDGDYLVLTVSNPIDGSATLPHKKGNQMAQQNIRQRLELAYGNRAEFNSNETKHSYSVILKVPLERVL